MMKFVLTAVLVSALAATPAAAEPPLAVEVYGATITPGVTEFETRYGLLTGSGPEAGLEKTKLEVAHGFSSRFWAGAVVNIVRDPGGARHYDGLELETRYALGQIGGIDLAAMAEYEVNRFDPDVLGGKLVAERRAGEFDARVNFIVEKPLVHDEPVAFGYAVAVTQEAVEHLHLGAMAVGGLGSGRRVTTRDEHFAGPLLRLEFEPGEADEGKGGSKHGGGFELEAGYLLALGRARDGSAGQLRLGIDYEARF